MGETKRLVVAVAAAALLGGAGSSAQANDLPVTGTLDLAGRSGSFAFEGTQKAGLAGASLAILGDFNGDGHVDVAIGEPRRDGDQRPNAGAVHVLFRAGRSEGKDLDRADQQLILGAAEDQAGAKVAPAGDVNGDGYSDLLVGAPAHGTTVGEDGRRVPGGGAAYLVFGRPGGAPIDLAGDDRTLRIDGGDANSRLGASVAMVPDLNGDGTPEIVVGAPSREVAGRDNAGSTYVVHGAKGPGEISVAGLVERGAGWRIDGPPAGPQGGALSGREVASIGDLSGDGRPELLITAPRAATGGADAKVANGRAYVVFGRPDPAVTDLNALDRAGFSIGRTTTETKGGADWLGESIAVIGDVNGDGKPDIGVGAHLADAPDRARAGAAYVIYGRSGSDPVDLDHLDKAAGYKIEGVAAGDMTGFAIAPAGDVNADKVDDFVVTAPFADPEQRTSAGAAYLVYGSSGGGRDTLDLSEFGDRALRLSGAEAGDVTGFATAGGADLDGDKGADALLGSTRIADDYLYSVRADRPGVARVVFGQTPITQEQAATATGPAAVMADPGYDESLKAGCRIATNVQALMEDNGYTDEAADPKRIRRDGMQAYVDDPRNADTVLGVSGFPSIFAPTVLGGVRNNRLIKGLQDNVDGEDDFPGYVSLVASLGVENPAAQARILLVDGYLFREMADYDGLTEGNPPTYIIAVGRPKQRGPSDIRQLQRLATDTKGGLYRAENPREIERAFQKIESRLRCDVAAETGFDEIFPGDDPVELVEDEVDEDAETADVELTWRDPDDGYVIDEVDIVDDDGDVLREIDDEDIADTYDLSRSAARRAPYVGGRGQTYRQLHIRKLRQGTRIRVKVRAQKGTKGGRVYARITQNRLRR